MTLTLQARRFIRARTGLLVALSESTGTSWISLRKDGLVLAVPADAPALANLGEKRFRIE
jgi:hypothetical protein